MTEEITNQQLLDAIKASELWLDAKIDGVESSLKSEISSQIAKVTEKVDSIGDTLAGVVDNMATKKDLQLMESRTNARFDDLELRLGRRIDKAYTGNYEH